MAEGTLTIHVAGYKQCEFTTQSASVAEAMTHLGPIKAEVKNFNSRAEYKEWLAAFRDNLGPLGSKHTSAPLIWVNDNEYVGGNDAFMEYVKREIMTTGKPSLPKVVHEAAPSEGDESKFDYDLVVIGGGSGGLACSKEAASLGARTAVLDFVKPSPAGSSWGLGGTCVNVGCIPKKLFHTAALLGESMTRDAKAFGWKVVEEKKNNWEDTVMAIQDYIHSLNFNYRVQLRDKNVKYINALGRLIDGQTIETTDRKNKKETIRAKRIVVAVGGRPRQLDIPGAEHCITSDDIFSKMDAPGKTLVVGASYVALECAGFLNGLGYDTTVMVRSILLRGFDQECAGMIEDYMREEGTKFIKKCVPTSIEKLENGKLKVTYESTEGEKFEGEWDTVLVAVGRYPDTKSLGLENAGVKTASSGKIITTHEQSSCPTVFAIGDVVENAPELTPVAIQAGRLLAQRLFGKSTEPMQYDKVATTVFTPLEYGCIGYSEEDAIRKFGSTDIEVYHSKWIPLEWSVVHDRDAFRAYAKLIVRKSDSNRVVGFHYCGPNAGEVTQGYGVALKMGATLDDVLSTVGIHPTNAEEFTVLSVTKSSGEDADKGGC